MPQAGPLLQLLFCFMPFIHLYGAFCINVLFDPHNNAKIEKGRIVSPIVEMEDLRLREVYLDVQGAESSKESSESFMADWPLLQHCLSPRLPASVKHLSCPSQCSELSSQILPFHSP